VTSNHNESTDDGSIAQLHSQLKNASVYSGIRGRPAVLLVHEGVGDECLADVCAFLKDGNCFLNQVLSMNLLLLQSAVFELVKFFMQLLYSCLLVTRNNMAVLKQYLKLYQIVCAC